MVNKHITRPEGRKQSLCWEKSENEDQGSRTYDLFLLRLHDEINFAIPHRHRSGSSCPAVDADQAVLRLQHEVWLAAQLGHLPGVSGFAWGIAGHESEGIRSGPQGGPGPQLPDCAVHQVGSQEL